MKTSYGEKLCMDLLKMWFPDKVVIYNHRPIWLRNSQTGRNLELDIYFPDLNLAVEFNGSQHKLLLQKRKDYYKSRKCFELGILLISVYHPMELFKFKSLIKRHTGIKLKSGRSDKKLLCNLRLYNNENKNESLWYIQAKEASDKALEDRIKGRLERIEARRALKRLKKFAV